MKDRRWAVALVLVAIAIMSRLMPHWHNFTSVGAAGIFGAWYFGRSANALLIPLVAMWLSDLFLNNVVYASFFEGFTWFSKGMLWVYLGFAGVVLVGSLLPLRYRLQHLGLISLASSLVFFLVSNYGAYLINPLYQGPAGLAAAYVAGLPFFWNTVIAHFFYCLLLFGGYQWAVSRHLIPAPARSN